LLLDIRETKVEQVRAAYAVRPFNGEVGPLKGAYYMLLHNEPGLLQVLQEFADQTVMTG
jgi:hypothetical protein